MVTPIRGSPFWSTIVLLISVGVVVWVACLEPAEVLAPCLLLVLLLQYSPISFFTSSVFISFLKSQYSKFVVLLQEMLTFFGSVQYFCAISVNASLVNSEEKSGAVIALAGNITDNAKTIKQVLRPVYLVRNITSLSY